MATTSTQIDLRTDLRPSHSAFSVLTGPIARALFALPFALFGLFHFGSAKAMAAMVPLPGGEFWVYLTGVALVAGAFGILLGKLADWAALGLALLLGTFVLLIHLPGVLNPATAQMSTISLLKDVALTGGALLFAGIHRARAQSST